VVFRLIRVWYHPLSAGAHFIGRQAEAGRTARLVADRLHRRAGPGRPRRRRQDGWGARFLDEQLAPVTRCGREPVRLELYQEPNAGRFLQEAFDYFSAGSGATLAKGAGLLHLLPMRDRSRRADPPAGAGRPRTRAASGGRRLRADRGPAAQGPLTSASPRASGARQSWSEPFPLTDLERSRSRLSTPRRRRSRPCGPSACCVTRRAGDDAALDRLIDAYGATPDTGPSRRAHRPVPRWRPGAGSECPPDGTGTDRQAAPRPAAACLRRAPAPGSWPYCPGCACSVAA